MDDFIARLRRCFSWTSVGELVKASVRLDNAPLGGARSSTAHNLKIHSLVSESAWHARDNEFYRLIAQIWANWGGCSPQTKKAETVKLEPQLHISTTY